MTTAQFVSWLSKRIAGNLFSRQELVDAIDQAQTEILGRDIKFMRVSPDPYIHTVGGTYEYVASTSLYAGVDNAAQFDIRDVKRVYAYNVRKSSIFAYGGLNRTSHKPEYEVNPMSSDEVEIPVDVVPSASPASSDCMVRFWKENNPGTNTTMYRAVAYRWPTRVTSESVALTLPVQWQRGLLKYAVLRDLEYTEFGSADKPELLYEKELEKFDTWSANLKTTASSSSTLPREC